MIDKSLGKFVEKGRLSAADRDAALARLTTGTSVDCLADVDYVVEAVFEDARASSARSSHDSIRSRGPTSFSRRTPRRSRSRCSAPRPTAPDKVLGMHFMNPVPLMTLVELIRGQATSAEAMMTATELCMRLGKTAVESADYPGFIANRILMPMINEAIFALMEGVGTSEADRHRDEAGHEPPDGPADARRLHRPRRVPRDHGSAAQPASAIRSTARARCCAGMVAAGHLGRKSGQGFYTY